jgi:hypothetical protein
MAGFREYGNEPSGCINGREFLYKLSNYHFLKKDSVHGISYEILTRCSLSVHILI